jgi:EmrB/QacA subfamily drug resistance transporter
MPDHLLPSLLPRLPHHKRLSYRWIVVIVAIFGTLMSAVDKTVINIALPQIQNAFGTDLHNVQWVSTSYLLATGIGVPTTPFFADTLGLKRFYLVSIALFTTTSILCGLAWNLPALILLRFVQGLSEAGLIPMSLAMIFREFPEGERGLASGVFGMPVLLAPVLAPTLGGYLISAAGWRLIFFINVPFGMVGLLLTLFALREERPQTRPAFDLPGFLLVASGLIMVLYALSQASVEGWTSLTVLGLLGLGLLCLGGFVLVELQLLRRGKAPLLDVRLLTNAAFSSATVASMPVYIATYGGLLLIPLYLQELRGLSALSAGVFLLPQGVVMMVTLAVGGVLVDHIGGKVVAILGLLCFGFSSWQLSFLTLSTPWWWLQVLFMLRGTAMGLVISPLQVIALSKIRQAQMPLASALSNVVGAVISSLGIAVLATIVQSRTADHARQLAEQVLQTPPAGLMQQASVLAMQDAFLVTTIMVGVALLAALLVREQRHRRPEGARASVSEGAERAGDHG